MKLYYSKYTFITAITLLLILTPYSTQAFIKTLENNQIQSFYNSIGANYSLANKVTFGEFIKLLLQSNNLDLSKVTVNPNFKFTDVPGEFELFAEKARQLGLVNYIPENPIFGYNSEVQISKALDLGFKYYGLSGAKYLIDKLKFSEQVSNFSPDFIYAALIEKGLNLGLITPKEGKVNFFGTITYAELGSILINLRLIQSQTNNISLDYSSLNTNLNSFNVSRNTDLENTEKFKIFEDVYRRLTSEFFEKDKIDKGDLLYGAISGMVEKLNDPYSTFQEPSEQKSFRDTLSNQVEGIGASLSVDDKKRIIVVSPLSDSPAEKAGLKPNDIITKINDELTLNMSLNQAVAKIQGEAGTEVKLQVERAGKVVNLTIIRASISVPSVTAEVTDEGIVVFKIRNFGLGIEDTFANYVDQLTPSSVKGVVLDLRNNPGGYLDSATDIAANFLDKNTLVSRVKYAGTTFQDNKTSFAGSLRNKPLTVVINQGTASAGEILAAALRDKAGAKLVGEKSFGKGTVQELITYSDDSALKLTVANWLTPNGLNVNKTGLIPDFTVSNSENDSKLGNDPQLNRAINLLK